MSTKEIIKLLRNYDGIEMWDNGEFIDYDDHGLLQLLSTIADLIEQQENEITALKNKSPRRQL